MYAPMTTLAQNSQVFDIITVMRTINMVHMKVGSMATNKTLVLKNIKRAFSVETAPFAIIRVRLSSTFIQIKIHLSTFSGTKPGRSVPTSFGLIGLPTTSAGAFNLSIPGITGALPTRSRTKMNGSRFLFSDIARALVEKFLTPFTGKGYFCITRSLVAKPGAIFSSIFRKCLAASGASFHKPSLTLAMANVNANR